MRPLVVKLLYHFTCRSLLQLSIELAATLIVRPVFTSNELLSMLAVRNISNETVEKVGVKI